MTFQPCGGGLEGTDGLKAEHELSVCARNSEADCLGLKPEQHGQQVKGGGCAPLFHPGETPT